MSGTCEGTTWGGPLLSPSLRRNPHTLRSPLRNRFLQPSTSNHGSKVNDGLGRFPNWPRRRKGPTTRHRAPEQGNIWRPSTPARFAKAESNPFPTYHAFQLFPTPHACSGSVPTQSLTSQTPIPDLSPSSPPPKNGSAAPGQRYRAASASRPYRVGECFGTISSPFLRSPYASSIGAKRQGRRWVAMDFGVLASQRLLPSPAEYFLGCGGWVVVRVLFFSMLVLLVSDVLPSSAWRSLSLVCHLLFIRPPYIGPLAQ